MAIFYRGWPMADVTPLIPILIGGGLALAGAGLTSTVSWSLKRQEIAASRKRDRAVKLEELVEAVYQLEPLDTGQRCAKGNEPTVGASPAT